MRSKLFAALLAAACTLSGAGPYRSAAPGYRYEFPRDHFDHPEFRTEWWYYTGNLRDASGRRFGFELTFFRHGASRDPKRTGVWDVRDLWLAHFAVSDVDGKRFFHTERLNRAGPGIAGADARTGRLWNGNWQAKWELDPQAPGAVRSIRIEAIARDFRVALSLRPLKPPAIHGVNGVSQKAAGEGRASHYISFTRLEAKGSVTLEGKEFAAQGLAWMDHEFFTHQLEPDQTGWDWLSLQFDDGSELMLFRLRRKDGSVDEYSAGTYVDARGNARHLGSRDFLLLPKGEAWKSSRTGATYPIRWEVRVPALDLEAVVSTRLPEQELGGKTPAAPAYWEGAMDARGTRESKPLSGSGYLEMTGYAGAVRFGD